MGAAFGQSWNEIPGSSAIIERLKGMARTGILRSGSVHLGNLYRAEGSKVMALAAARLMACKMLSGPAIYRNREDATFAGGGFLRAED